MIGVSETTFACNCTNTGVCRLHLLQHQHARCRYIYAFLVHQAVPEELTWGEVLCVYARAASELQYVRCVALAMLRKGYLLARDELPNVRRRPLTALAQELASHAPFRASETTALIKRVQNVFHFYCNEDKTGSPSALGQRRVHLCRRQLVELLVRSI